MIRQLIRLLILQYRFVGKHLRKRLGLTDNAYLAARSRQDKTMPERQLDLFAFLKKSRSKDKRRRVVQPAATGKVIHHEKPNVYRSLVDVPFREHHRFYDQLVQDMKSQYGISIRKWRSSMSGVAYELHYNNGDVRRMISAPRPRSPVSACIFMHEVGHHAVGFKKFRPRCLEEYHVWQWAFEQMRKRGIAVDRRVERHYRRSMYHYVRLAKKRGLKVLPPVLEPFQTWPG